jgi:glucuronoxylan 4-O-methyltransferase
MIDETFEQLLSEKMEKSNHGQMTAEEYRYIAGFLGDKNFLVFGTGHDTPMWRYANRNGKTLFLENNKRWINPSDTDVITVTYTTKRAYHKELLEEWRNEKFDNLKMDLPDEVTQTKWDCIFVDAPLGTTDKKPGRMQSIFTAWSFSTDVTDVFVHDVDRVVEDVYSKTMFSNNIKELTKLRHVRK